MPLQMPINIEPHVPARFFSQALTKEAQQPDIPDCCAFFAARLSACAFMIISVFS